MATKSKTKKKNTELDRIMDYLCDLATDLECLQDEVQDGSISPNRISDEIDYIVRDINRFLKNGE